MSEEPTITASPDEAAPPSTTTDVPPTVTRPRLNLSSGPSRRGGKSMFGLVLGTLNKAKIEEKQRDASEAAKKRQMIEKRLQAKLRSETAEVRKAEESKKDKTSATRKEEDLGVKLSVYKLRRTRLPLLSNFLLTSDVISDEATMETETEPQAEEPQSEAQAAAKILAKASAQRSQPPPLYYLPKLLLPAQEAFLNKRKKEVTSAAATEWSLFVTERDAGVKEIRALREKVIAAQSKPETDAGDEGDADMNVDRDGSGEGKNGVKNGDVVEADGAMDVDMKPTQPENEGDDAVEY